MSLPSYVITSLNVFIDHSSLGFTIFIYFFFFLGPYVSSPLPSHSPQLLKSGFHLSFGHYLCLNCLPSNLFSYSFPSLLISFSLLSAVLRSQMTCLMLAAREGHSKIINLLVSHSAEINFQDGNGYTVCHFFFFFPFFFNSSEFSLW